ncbi:MAG: hypothetical protein ACFCGT_11970 [Sandaracinaceae bacterium]
MIARSLAPAALALLGPLVAGCYGSFGRPADLDAGEPPRGDARPAAPDLGAPDLGAPDGGPLDHGAVDLGAPDLGPPDLGADSGPLLSGCELAGLRGPIGGNSRCLSPVALHDGVAYRWRCTQREVIAIPDVGDLPLVSTATEEGATDAVVHGERLLVTTSVAPPFVASFALDDPEVPSDPRGYSDDGPVRVLAARGDLAAVGAQRGDEPGILRLLRLGADGVLDPLGRLDLSPWQVADLSFADEDTVAVLLARPTVRRSTEEALVVVDVSDPSAPLEAGRRVFGATILDQRIATVGATGLTVGPDLQVLDLDDRQHLPTLAQEVFDEVAVTIAADAFVAYLGTTGVLAYDLSNPRAPRRLAASPPTPDVIDLAVDDGLVALSTDRGLYVLDFFCDR